jgi:hypothetical protein
MHSIALSLWQEEDEPKGLGRSQAANISIRNPAVWLLTRTPTNFTGPDGPATPGAELEVVIVRNARKGCQ